MQNTIPSKKFNKKVFIGGLDRKVCQDKVRSFFEKLGPVLDFELKKKRPTSPYSLGYAILTTNSKTFDQLVFGQPLRFEGRKIECKPFLSGEKLTKFNIDFNRRRIYVDGLPIDANNEDLIRFFQKFGKVQNAYMIIDFVSRKPNGKAFVLFVDKKAADLVVSLDLKFKGNEISCTLPNKLNFLNKKLAEEQRSIDRRKKPKHQNQKKKRNRKREKKVNYCLTESDYVKKKNYPINNTHKQKQGHQETEGAVRGFRSNQGYSSLSTFERNGNSKRQEPQSFNMAIKFDPAGRANPPNSNKLSWSQWPQRPSPKRLFEVPSGEQSSNHQARFNNQQQIANDHTEEEPQTALCSVVKRSELIRFNHHPFNIRLNREPRERWSSKWGIGGCGHFSGNSEYFNESDFGNYEVIQIEF